MSENDNLPPQNPPEGTPPSGGDKDVSPIAIEEEMSRSYLDYAMSVIVSRALPDIRDGLKPVHRRILFSMNEMGYDFNKPYRKSARVVGDVIGKYHPHGDQSIYDALVRMAQDFSMRLPLLDGQGNFGSIDGDPAAAMRYTEVRMGKTAHFLMQDLDKDTVDFQENYDNSEQEPTVLPARFPNLLVNGASGIAVGMATNVPPHNLGEVVDACVAFLANPELTVEDLMEFVPGPDFPTGGIILGHAGSRSAAHTGRGSIIMRGKVDVEEIRKDRLALIVTEIPYQVNKTTLIEKIAELVRDKRIEGISDLRDESDRDGMRMVIELKRDAVPEVVLNQLYRFSQLQTSFGANTLALHAGKPELFNLRDLIRYFIEFREEVITRRTKFELNKARDRAHVLVGLGIAVANIDEIIALIRRAPNPATAREQLMVMHWPAADVLPLLELIADPRHKVSDDGTIQLSEEQARAILELRLARLTALGRDEIGDELKILGEKIEDYLDILRSRARVYEIIETELLETKEEFATPRRSQFIESGGEMDDEDLIQREDMVVTVTHGGYIKRVALSTYRPQKRGGKGRSGMSTRDEDFVNQLFVASTHSHLLFFSSKGMVYKLKVWRLPLATPQGRGKAMINLLPLAQDEKITTILPLPEDEDNLDRYFAMFSTASGNVRRNQLSDFTNVMVNGKIAMKLDEGDNIVDVAICTEDDDIMLTTGNGKAIRFPAIDIRVFKGRASTGVRGIKLAGDDKVISMALVRHVDASPAEARAYLKQAAMMRRAATGEQAPEEEPVSVEEEGEALSLSPERYAELGAYEQFVLTVTENGFGKRSSSYEYRTSNRGGQGIIAMTVSARNGKLIASFSVEDNDQIMLVTDGGQLIRCPVDDVRVAARNTQGVTIFRTAKGESVVSVEHIGDVGQDDNEADGDTDGETGDLGPDEPQPDSGQDGPEDP